MKVVYRAEDGYIFETKEKCLCHELEKEEREMVVAGREYMRYRKYLHKKHFDNYIKYKKTGWKAICFPREINSNTKKGKGIGN